MPKAGLTFGRIGSRPIAATSLKPRVKSPADLGSFVIAHNTSLTYKGKPVDAKQVGRELGVRYVLEGSVRRARDQVEVNVQLIDAESGAHVWADRFETNRRNLAEAKSEITGRSRKLRDRAQHFAHL